MNTVEVQAEKGVFFVAGGTLPLHSSSYLERAADKQLLDSLLQGRFCYVLNSRQMGKSSLCVRTMDRLSERDVRSAFIDITKIGGRNVTAEQWYAGLTIEVGRTLGLRDQFLSYWKSESHLSPMQRFFGSLRDVILETIPGKVVIFVDEIDSTRSLPFNADEFFAGVRECFNRRVQDKEYERLTFCFLGVAVPSDLIQDARTTPFNIGDRIYLRDFTLDELTPLAFQLGPNGEDVLRRVHFWTNGHPFLTQSVCRALAQSAAPTEAAVDGLIQRDLLEPKVRETNINLSDVGNRVLNGCADGDDVDQYRADVLSAYEKAIVGKASLADDESNRTTAVLKLSGLMRSEAGQLKVRNRIYERAFDTAWIRENMPGQELRRQRIAYLKGVARTTAIASAIVAVISYLAFSNYRMKVAAEETALEMRWRAYIADMNRLPIVLEQNNVPLMEKLLEDHQNDPWRGAEWDYWNGAIHTALWETTKEFGKLAGFNPNGNLPQIMLTSERGGLVFIDRTNGKVVRQLNLPHGPRYLQLRGGKRLMAVFPAGGGEMLDAETGKVLRRIPKDTILFEYGFAFDANGRYGLAERGLVQGVLDLETQEFVVQRADPNSFFPIISEDGRQAVLIQTQGKVDILSVYDLDERKPLLSFNSLGKTRSNAISDKNRDHIVGYEDGMVRRFNGSDGKLLWELKVANDAITHVATSLDGTVVVAGTRKRRSYQIRNEGNRAHVVRSYLDSSYPLVSGDGKFIYTLYWTMRCYPASDGEPVKSFRPEGRWGIALVRNPDRLILIGLSEARILPLVGGTLGTPEVFRYPQGLEFWTAARDDTAVLLTDGKSTVVYDIAARQKRLLTIPEKPINDGFVRLDSQHILYTRDRLKYQVYDLSSGLKTRDVIVFKEATDINLSPDGGHLIARSQSGALELIDPLTLTQKWRVANAHERPMLASQFSRDCKLMATPSHDDTCAVWNVSDGTLVSRLFGHAQSVTRADFTRDGKRILTVSDDQTLRVWDVKTGAELTTIGTVGDFPLLCKVTTDGRHLVTANAQGLIKIWPLYGAGSKIQEGRK